MKIIPVRRPIVLTILDGWGQSEIIEGNAVRAAKTPNLDRLAREWPTAVIGTSGEDVGLPAGQMGNSEVGHINLGAGRIVYQDLSRISQDMESGNYLQNTAFLQAISNVKEQNSALHLMGLLSDGGVHSHLKHLFGLLDLAAHHGLEQVYVHAFYDGRDVSPTSGLDYTRELLQKMQELGTGRLASLCGRYYAMDRDLRWERVQKAYQTLVEGTDLTTADPLAYIAESYAKDITDEFLLPVSVIADGGSPALIKAHDSVIFFNFRPDRARELTRSFMQPDFTGFPLPKGRFPLCFVTMTDYDDTFRAYPGLLIAYDQEQIEDTLGQYLSQLGLRQLRIAETEKYAHVTFFFNAGREEKLFGEDHILIPSPKVATYDLQPAMSAPEVTAEVLRRLDTGLYDVVILNYANCDMVGHTGVFAAAVQAVETVDASVDQVVQKVLDQDGIVLITADHGNAEQMIDRVNGGAFTAHTSNPVLMIGAGIREGTLRGGRLCDIAPTMLDLMGIPAPEKMTGESLLVRPII